MATQKKKAGAPRKWTYRGEKKNVTIRLTEQEKEFIKTHFNSIQAFVQFSLEVLQSRASNSPSDFSQNQTPNPSESEAL